ncbi:hypothetical protein N7532_007407 [Penicillium argentinense]|uniref:Aminoglycoside phosphotransferase domain-containing protein n=1 Tax=Penicillium argentinense TaxID=1131581 RepID=A0A9W9K7A4_9EURO|nr:uncharacterized protein N7532_007407 [Penicillium argentinense]KAJ5095116.1 hypothetical protein N7532_007407 [Penicillium argentinense]
MSAANDPATIASALLSTHDLDLISYTTLQRLWAGYGQICAITARARTDSAAAYVRNCQYLGKVPGEGKAKAGDTFPLILKLISPPPAKATSSSSGKMVDEGHLRKIYSYEVEQFFYSKIVPLLGDLGVARCLASTYTSENEEEESGLTATIITDLRPLYPVSGEKRSALSPAQVHGALSWLSKFHASTFTFTHRALGEYILPPLEEHDLRIFTSNSNSTWPRNGVWLNGGYTYLSTRRNEYASLREDGGSEWSEAFCTPTPTADGGGGESIAELAAKVLTPRSREIESLIHGDVKSENLFTTSDGDVAFFDFQYTGLGLGVCDLAKLFTCSVPLPMLLQGGGQEDKYDEYNLSSELAMCAGEKDLLQRYRAGLLEASGNKEEFYPWDVFIRHWETALVDWCRFQASWGFWGEYGVA